MLHHKKKWVIVFLIYADFRRNKEDFGSEPFAMNEEMKIEIDLMFKEILTTPLNPENAKLFVILHSIKYKVEDAQELRIENKTLFYEITNPDNKPSNQFGDFQIIDSNLDSITKPNPNTFQIPNKLTPILEKIKIKDDEEVFLITWDHGSAFGIFRELTPPLSSVIRRKP